MVFCFPFISPGAGEGTGSKPRALEASPQFCLGLPSGSLSQDVSVRLCPLASVSLPRACPRCWHYISDVCWVTVCTCTCLPLSFAFCLVPLHRLLVRGVRLSCCSCPSLTLPLMLLHAKSLTVQAARSGFTGGVECVCVYAVLMESPGTQQLGRGLGDRAQWRGGLLWADRYTVHRQLIWGVD